MNDESSKPDPHPAPSSRRPLWLRLFPFYSLLLLIVWLAVNRHVVDWLETNVGLGVVGASLAHLVVIVALVGIPFYFVLLDEHRRNRT